MKEFKTLNGIGVKDPVARKIARGFMFVEPSNDTTGATDVQNIQEALNQANIVRLASGTYYINQPLIMATGRELIGEGVKTLIRVVGGECAIKGHPDGFDHIRIVDIYLANDTIADTIGINLEGNDTEEYNGARYSHIDGVRLSGFGVGLRLKGMWSTVFERIRTMNCTKGVEGLGCLNNITFDKCEFTHGTIGVNLTCDGSTECYGIRINNCNFEGNTECCVFARGVIKLSINDIYSEQTPILFKVNSCPQFTIDGGYVRGITYTSSITSTGYTTDLFQNPKASIKNLYIICTINENLAMVYCDSGVTNCEFFGNRILNRGTGKVNMVNNMTPIINKVCHQHTENLRIRYTEDYKKYCVPEKRTNEVWCPKELTMTLQNNVTTTTQIRYTLRMVQADGSYKDIGHTQYLNTGAHTSGEQLTVSFIEKPLLTDKSVLFWLIPSNDPKADVTYNVEFIYQVGVIDAQI